MTIITDQKSLTVNVVESGVGNMEQKYALLKKREVVSYVSMVPPTIIILKFNTVYMHFFPILS